MPPRRIRADRPLSAAERQARYRSRYNRAIMALDFIAERAVSIEQARRVAVAALKGRIDWTEIHGGPGTLDGRLPPIDA